MRSILIANEPVRGFPMPWRYDGTCYGFLSPTERLCRDELDKIGDGTDVEGLIICEDLPDYGFIAELLNLRQLYIYTGKILKDMEFVRPLTRLQNLYIRDSHISSIEPFEALAAEKTRLLEEANRDTKSIFTYCVRGVYIGSDLLDCDIEALKKYPVLYFKEFHIKKSAARE